MFNKINLEYFILAMFENFIEYIGIFWILTTRTIANKCQVVSYNKSKIFVNNFIVNHIHSTLSTFHKNSFVLKSDQCERKRMFVLTAKHFLVRLKMIDGLIKKEQWTINLSIADILINIWRGQ